VAEVAGVRPGACVCGPGSPTTAATPLDPSDAIARELARLIRAIKDLHGVVVPAGAPTLERPAFLLLLRIAEHGPARPSALADSLYLDLSTVSRQLGALEVAGWVARERDAGDRRAQLVRVTPEGERVLELNHRARRDLLDEILTGWPAHDQAAFAAHLARFNESVQHRRQCTARQEIR
jgi:DNA-binding MarR family transcriptional regulator